MWTGKISERFVLNRKEIVIWTMWIPCNKTYTKQNEKILAKLV